MCLLGFDVEAPEPDLAGFSVEVKAPGEPSFTPLKNRIAFSYDQPAATAVNGDRNFSSLAAPFQKFRWIHFPWRPLQGAYVYRATKQHMPRDGQLVAGTSVDIDLELKAVTYYGLLDVGFTRNFASSQAYREQFGNNPGVIPADAAGGLEFQKLPLTTAMGESVYKWLGFEAFDLLFGFLDEALADPGVTVDAMIYDLNEPDIAARLERFGTRLRAIVDDSKGSGGDGGHDGAGSPESRSAARFAAAGGQVVRTHFKSLQHNKVLIVRRNGVAERVLCGSTNFTFRGLYIQANNMMVFRSPGVAALFGDMFDLAFASAKTFAKDDFAKHWHIVDTPGQPTVQICFSPHLDTDVSLAPVRDAIDGAASSVFYSVAFLSQLTSGPTFDAFARLPGRQVFSYGTVDKRGKLELRKPDGSVGVVDFAYLASKAPAPFGAEWQAGQGRNIHNKFVVTDFSKPTAKLFTGSSNLSPSGERGNGDHLVLIEDRKVATSYAIEGARIFDHLQFRNRMRDALDPAGRPNPAAPPPAITLKKPASISGQKAWFERFYEAGSQAMRDRQLFSE